MSHVRAPALIGLILLAAACGQQKSASNMVAPANSAQAATPGTAAPSGEWRTTASGLRYRRVNGDGTGPKPRITDTVTIHYVGQLTDGTEFDSSFKGGAPVTMPLAGLIAGWREGVPLMSVGDVYEFMVPPELGYGPEGGGPIPPNSTLYFRVGLIGIEGQG